MRQLLIILSILIGLSCKGTASSNDELTPREQTSELYKKITNAQERQRWKIILENLPSVIIPRAYEKTNIYLNIINSLKKYEHLLLVERQFENEKHNL